MTAFDLQDPVPAPDRIEPTQPIGMDAKKLTTPTPFAPFMQPTATPNPTSQAPSPFDLSQGGGKPIAGTPSMDSLLAQINMSQATIGDIQKHLNTPNLKLNRAQKYLLGNKLADAKAHITSATSKVGVEAPQPKEVTPGSTPLSKFLSILTDGQYQLEAAKNQLEKMKGDGKTVNPAELLLMQVKLGKAQNEIEYSSVLVSKAVDSMKQLFSIQL